VKTLTSKFSHHLVAPASWLSETNPLYQIPIDGITPNGGLRQTQVVWRECYPIWSRPSRLTLCYQG